MLALGFQPVYLHGDGVGENRTRCLENQRQSMFRMQAPNKQIAAWPKSSRTFQRGALARISLKRYSECLKAMQP